jgi:hypothetical protein
VVSSFGLDVHDNNINIQTTEDTAEYTRRFTEELLEF